MSSAHKFNLILSFSLQIFDISFIKIVKNKSPKTDSRGQPYLMYRSDDLLLLIVIMIFLYSIYIYIYVYIYIYIYIIMYKYNTYVLLQSTHDNSETS